MKALRFVIGGVVLSLVIGSVLFMGINLIIAIPCGIFLFFFTCELFVKSECPYCGCKRFESRWTDANGITWTGKRCVNCDRIMGKAKGSGFV